MFAPYRPFHIVPCILITFLPVQKNTLLKNECHFDTSDQRKPQGYISHIALTTGRCHDTALWLGQYHDTALWLGKYDIALTTTAFDAEAVTKHRFPLIIYIELLKALNCGFEFNMMVWLGALL